MDTSHQFEWCASATAAAVASRFRTGVSDVKGVDGVNQIGGIGSAEQPTKDERWGINGNGRMNRIIATKALYTPRVLRLDGFGWDGMGVSYTDYYVLPGSSSPYGAGRTIRHWSVNQITGNTRAGHGESGTRITGRPTTTPHFTASIHSQRNKDQQCNWTLEL